MTSKLVLAVAGALAALCVGQSHAAIVTLTVNGVVSSGHDLTGYFGPAGSLAGDAFQETVTYQTPTFYYGSYDAAEYLVCGSGYGPCPVLKTSLTIGSKTFVFNNGYSTDLNSAPGSVGFTGIDQPHGAIAVNGKTYTNYSYYDADSMGISQSDLPWYLNASFHSEPGSSGFGTFQMFFVDKLGHTVLWDANGALEATSFEASCQGADCNVAPSAANEIPEPSTWAMLLLGVGMIGGALRCRGAARRGLTEA